MNTKDFLHLGVPLGEDTRPGAAPGDKSTLYF